MNKEQVKLLAEKYVLGNATPEEETLLFKIYQEYQSKGQEWDETLMGDQESIRRLLYTRINSEIQLADAGTNKHRSIFQLPIFRYVAAAIILLSLSTGGYFLIHKQPVSQIAQNKTHDIAPGGNKATLTISNGTKIDLTDAKNGKLAQQGNTIVTKTGSGEIVYTAARSSDNPVAYNTVTTPRKGFFHVVLPDSSQAWLDAASSIKYQTAFTGNERKVEITGQVYFEVKHNAAKPFRVVSRGQTVEVLGTHFNINAYNDEPDLRTTLLEGRVKVTKGNETAYLKPGQQSIIQSLNNSIIVKDADMDMAIAWKNGLFQFDNTSLPEVMRQLARWYDVEIAYDGTIPDRTFTGKIHKDLYASDALEILKFTKVHFKIEGKKIIVTP